MDRIIDFLEKNPVVYFATAENGNPRVRPLGFHMVFEDKLYFGVGAQKQSYRQMLENPNVEFCVADAAGTFLRVRAVAAFDQRPAVLERAFETMPHLKEMYNEKTGHSFALFSLEDGRAEIADLKGHFEQFTF